MALVVVVLAAGSAHAATGYSHIGEFGGAGAAPGLFHHPVQPQRMAVHDASGVLLVADRGNNRVQIFGPSGTGVAYRGEIAITAPIGVAVDQVSAALYVSSAGAPHRIAKFLPDDPTDPGSYVEDLTFASPPVGAAAGELGSLQAHASHYPSAGGLAVDPVTRELLVLDVGKRLVQRYADTGWDGGAGFVGAFDGSSAPHAKAAFTNPKDIAVTQTGEILVADMSGSFNGARARIDRYDSAGQLISTLSSDNNPVPNAVVYTSSLTIAVDRSSNESFISSKTRIGLQEGPWAIAQFDGDVLDRIFEVPPADRKLGAVNGIAVKSTSPKRLYVLASQTLGNDFLMSGPARVQVFEEAVPAEVEYLETTDIGPDSATLNGRVNPNGSAVTWHFQYRRQGTATWQSTATEDEPAGTEDIPVSAQATGLEPNIPYEARLVAVTSQGLSSESALETFTTLPAPPVITHTDATDLRSDSATLLAVVNPLNSPTEYWFEYGTDAAQLDRRIPLDTDTADAGAGGAPVVVKLPIDGLEPGQQYSFKVVASNQAGETEGDVNEFTTLSHDPGLGPERAYEIASDYPSNGIPFHNIDFLSTDGNRLMYHVDIPHPRIPAAGDEPHFRFIAERGEDGWHSRGADMFFAQPLRMANARMVGWPQDVSKLYYDTWISNDPDDQNHDLADEDRSAGRDIYVADDDGGFSWISRDARHPLGTPYTNSQVAEFAAAAPWEGMSQTGDVLVFSARRSLLDADPLPDGAHRLYEWTDGELRYVGRRPDGTVPTAGSMLGSGGPQPADVEASNAVSRDGRQVVWSAPRHDAAAGSRTLYLRRDGQSVEVSRETGVAALPSPHPMSVVYRGASRDGSRVFFTSSSRLTPDSGASNTTVSPDSDLYVYDREADTVVDITPRLDGGQDPVVAPAADARARVLGVSEISDDGSRVYFVANGVLDAERSPTGALPSALGRNLYQAELGASSELVRLRFVASLSSSDEVVWGTTHRSAAIDADGTTFAFATALKLTERETGGFSQAYVYDSDANSLACASCPATGVPAGHANMATKSILGTWRGKLRRSLSSDGVLFFHTGTRLLDADNNDVFDVYEYRSGELRLISAGTGTDHSFFQGASEDGGTVILMTPVAMIPEDGEPGMGKFYAARVGGGFPRSTPARECVGEECQGDLGRAPAERSPGSASAVSRGNVRAAPRRPACAALAAKRKQLTRKAALARKTARSSKGARAKRARRNARRFTRQAKAVAKMRSKRCTPNDGKAGS